MPDDLRADIGRLGREIAQWDWPPAILANHDQFPAVAERDERTRRTYAGMALERLQSAADALADGDTQSAAVEYDRAFSLWAHFIGQWDEVAASRERQRRSRRSVPERVIEDTIPQAVDAAAAAARAAGQQAAKATGDLALAAVAIAVIYVVSRKR